MPFMPSGVFSARSSTPALHPPVHVTFEKMATSWNDLSSTSQPPPGCFGVPMISPSCAFQAGAPGGFHPVSADPLKATSGLKVGPAAFMDRTSAQTTMTTTDSVLDIEASALYRC